MIKTGVSLFAGVGGFDLALERNGINVVSTVEIDEKASKVLSKHFPNAKLFGDIKEVTGEQLISAGFNPREGIFTGGFPCQDLSVAGKRAGLEGERSGLFWEICRLLRETKAQNFILENVPGLLSSNEGRDMAIVIEALVELGYGIAWRVLDAQHFGVPQRRRRVFIVGCLGDSGRTPAEILALAESRSRYLEAIKTKRKETTRKITDGAGVFGQSSFAGYSEGITTLTATSYKRPEDNIIVGALQASDYKFPQQQQAHENKIVITQEPIVFYGNRVGDIRVQDEVINTLQARMGTGGGNTPIVAAIPIHDKATRHNGKRTTADGKELQDGAGNGLGIGDEGDPMNTLTQGDRHAIFLPNNPTVRRLTPVECERLQGFPDNWTEGQADSSRYKQMGNAVAVPVVQWLIGRFKAHAGV